MNDISAAILQSIPLPALIVDNRLNIVHINAACAEMLKQEGVEGQSLRALFDKQSCRRLLNKMETPCSASGPGITVHLNVDAAVCSVAASWKQFDDGVGEGYLLILNPVDEYLNEIEHLRFYATRDSLTGCLNRWAFFSRFDEEFQKAERHQAPLSLIILDVDRFKQVNDTHGHLAGDELLRRLSAIAGNSLRKSDILARIGGDEFAILMPHTDILQAQKVAERLEENINSASFPFEKHTITLGVSIGIASTTECRSNMRALINNCDQALYRAKRNGRGKRESYTKEVA